MAYIKDLGGYINKEGYRIKEGYIIKSSYLKKNMVKKIKAKKVIDMRTRIERLQKPELYDKSIEEIWIPIFDDAASGITHEKQSRLEQMQNVTTLDIIYRGVLTEEVCYTRLAEVVKTIMHSDSYPIMYHCSEGKDRTGMITMILLSMLGFDEEFIINDEDCVIASGTYSSSRAGMTLHFKQNNMFEIDKNDLELEMYYDNDTFVKEVSCDLSQYIEDDAIFI